jgi:N-acetylneuraminic acid mutarotase
MGGWAGVYGTQGVPAATNVPGSRDLAVSWIDRTGNLWLFGGGGLAANPESVAAGLLNDLWEFNPTTSEWTWVSGSQVANSQGVYGTKGVPAAGNVPAARSGAVSWTDNNGNLWLFGGGIYEGGGIGSGASNVDSSLGGSPSGAGAGTFNDLWEFNPTTSEWTWVTGSGSQVAGSYGVYGTLGVPATTNTPGSRSGAVTWTDSSGNLWLFGGYGDASSGIGLLNDLWEFNPTTSEWTWVSGSNSANAQGVYGTQGVPASTNVPGARNLAVSWTVSNGNFWIFGGNVSSVAGSIAGGLVFNDLWEFNPTTKEWTWVSGSQTAMAEGVYGTQGVPASTNVPGGHELAVSWTDSSGNLWLFGGDGVTTSGLYGFFNDLWEFNPQTMEWTWVTGDSGAGSWGGVYGTEGAPADTNLPGARNGVVSWTDSKGNLWLFGGEGYADVGTGGFFNDLWRYQP